MPDPNIVPTWTTILPALVAIVVAFATRQVVVALLSGVLVGSGVVWLQTGSLSQANPITAFLLPQIGSTSFAQILLIYLWCLGGLIGIWDRTGGARHFAERVGERMASGPRTGLLFSWLVGIVFHQGGTVSTVLAGTTVKPVTDRHRVSHEELSYVVDSTASPIATVIPFNAWPVYVGGIAAGTVAFLPADDPGRAIEFFFDSILFNFYGMFAVLFTLLFSLGLLPIRFPRMRRAIERARNTGALDSDNAEPMLESTEAPRIAEGYTPALVDFFAPLLTLLGFAIVPYALAKAGVIENGNWINEAFCLSLIAAVITAKVRGMRVATIVNAFVDGCQRMTIGAIVLALAVTLGGVSKGIGTGEWVSTALSESIAPVVLPALLMVLCMVIAFATGSAWGTYAVVVPTALPLAWQLSPDETFLSICFGAVIGGGVFGDQCSPISDTTILSSMFTGCDLMDHVRTQLPLALSAAGCGAVLSTICAAVV